MRPLLGLVLLLATSCQHPNSTRSATAANEVTFFGTCDASGAVTLDPEHLAVADDENDVLRIYHVRGGTPLFERDLGPGLARGADVEGIKPAKPGKPRKPRESDIEAGTRLGDLALWLTSHGRSSSGALRPERFRFFATRIQQNGAAGSFSGAALELTGAPYPHLVDDILTDPRYAAFGLQAAVKLPPKAPGGFNIEGMTERAGGGVWIGLRSPLVNGRAIVFSLHNPEQLIAGQRAAIGAPVLLDLGGLGVRALSAWRGQVLVVAGPSGSEGTSRVFTWDQKASVAPVVVDLKDYNPEGVFSPESSDRVMLLSDDGAARIDGTECKRLKDGTQKRFRGLWIAP